MEKLLGAILLSILLVSSSCTKDRIIGGGSIITEDRNIKNFTKIGLAGSSNVTVVKGDIFNVRLKGYSNLLPYFETRVINGSLEMGFREDVNVKHSNIDIIVTLPVLNGVEIAGSGNITSTGDFTNNNQFETNIAGSGNIILERGSAVNFSTSILGSGNVEAYGFTAEKATIEIAGSGDTRITATNKLQLKIDGSGSVFYKGYPQLSVNINGSGKVVKQ